MSFLDNDYWSENVQHATDVSTIQAYLGKRNASLTVKLQFPISHATGPALNRAILNIITRALHFIPGLNVAVYDN